MNQAEQLVVDVIAKHFRHLFDFGGAFYPMALGPVSQGKELAHQKNVEGLGIVLNAFAIAELMGHQHGGILG